MATQQQPKSPFAYGTTRRPVPISLGGRLNYPVGTTANITVSLSPIPKSGFLSRLRYEFVGGFTVGTLGTQVNIPIWNMITNYSLTNSLGYAYRNMVGESMYFMDQIIRGTPGDPVIAAPTASFPVLTSTGAKTFAVVLYDDIGMNDGINFDRFLLSAQTLDNDLTASFTYSGTTAPLTTGTGTGALVITPGTFFMTCNVTAEYYTVPDTSQYLLPDTSIVQQIIDDPTYTTVVAGVNNINLLPIQGPEFLGVGFQVFTNGTFDSANALTNVLGVQMIANGTDTIMQWTGQDLIQAYYERFNRAPVDGWFYLDFCDDISLPNAMGPVERLVFSTQAYSQLTLQVTLASGTNVTAPNSIKLLKRMQSEVAA